MSDMLDRLKQRRDDRGTLKFFGVRPALTLWTAPKQAITRVKERVRILPPTKDMDTYYVEYNAHFNLGSRKRDSVLCGRDKYGDCPICDVVGQMYDSQLDEARDVKRRGKFLVHLLSRDRDGVFIGMLGSALEQQITGLMLGSDVSDGEDDADVPVAFGDITDPVKGRDIIVVTIEKAKSSPLSYYKVLATKAASPIMASKAQIKEILGQRVDLHEMIDAATPDLRELQEHADRLASLYLDRPSTNVSRQYSDKEEDNDDDDGLEL